ncbi:hypothetical protein [uncultured Lacinutrix sp.]|uniref:hypothetical protein n=1 Tax=uncultured Lacinutrix sp. TaxID=574032 RepID=UPI0026225447|nr:hypothetical protein [uncultured Lacinutrix sp.]
MFEFLFKNSLYITHCIEFIAAVIGVFYIRKHQGTAAVFFIIILVYLFFVDIIGTYYNNFLFFTTNKESVFYLNYWWFTIFFDIIAVILFVILYQKILKNERHKLILKYGASIYFVIATVLILYNTETLFKSSFPTLYILGAILIICCSGFYFIQILKDENLLTFSRSLYFYISTAIFLWWLIITPLVFYDMYYILEDKSFILLKRGIYIFSNMFMYLTFAIGLIVSKPEVKA